MVFLFGRCQSNPVYASYRTIAALAGLFAAIFFNAFCAATAFTKKDFRFHP